MKIIYSEAHRGHGGAMELRGADWVPMAECPERMTVILNALAGRPHVFNLGHGIGQHTPIEHVEQLLGVVRSWRAS